MRRLGRLLRDERGTLYEIPILIVVFMIALAVAIGEGQKHGLGRALLAFVLVVVAVVGGFAALVFGLAGLGKLLDVLMATRLAKAVFGEGGLQKAADLLGWILLALLMGALGTGFAAVMTDVFNASPRAAEAWMIGAGVGGLAAVAFAARRSLKKKTPPAS